MYAEGKGVPQDYKQAYIWSSLSAITGNSDAVKNRDILEKLLSPSILESVHQEIKILYDKIEADKTIKGSISF